MTFGGQGGFSKVGATDVTGARRQVDMCLDAGINLFDTANIYSGGESEEILGRRSPADETPYSSRRRSACP
jgi:aryl-alcohol dehydrogenase-like predicted oxidoreductase